MRKIIEKISKHLEVSNILPKTVKGISKNIREAEIQEKVKKKFRKNLKEVLDPFGKTLEKC